MCDFSLLFTCMSCPHHLKPSSPLMCMGMVCVVTVRVSMVQALCFCDAFSLLCDER